MKMPAAATELVEARLSQLWSVQPLSKESSFRFDDCAMESISIPSVDKLIQGSDSQDHFGLPIESDAAVHCRSCRVVL